MRKILSAISSWLHRLKQPKHAQDSGTNVKQTTLAQMQYRTSDGRVMIEFLFANRGPALGWRIYIVTDIDYGSRLASDHDTHSHRIESDTYKTISWIGKISTLDQAKAVAALWADATSEYIFCGGKGVSFDMITQKLIIARR